MDSWTVRRLGVTVTFLLLTAVLVPPAGAETAAAPAEPGDLWEVTSQMSMEGMAFAIPAQKMKVCAPKVWTEAPGGADERQKCKASDFRMEGSTATWKIRCAGGMTGEGQVTRDGSEAYSGTVKMTAEEGAVTINLDGRRISDCEVKK